VEQFRNIEDATGWSEHCGDEGRFDAELSVPGRLFMMLFPCLDEGQRGSLLMQHAPHLTGATLHKVADKRWYAAPS
jgi:hypothetical protein